MTVNDIYFEEGISWKQHQRAQRLCQRGRGQRAAICVGRAKGGVEHVVEAQSRRGDDEPLEISRGRESHQRFDPDAQMMSQHWVGSDGRLGKGADGLNNLFDGFR